MRLLAVVDLWATAARYKLIPWQRCTDVAHQPQTALARHRDIDNWGLISMASCALSRLLGGKARARSVWNPTADRLAAKEQVTGAAQQ